MRYETVLLKKIRAVCDLLEASPDGPRDFEKRLAAAVFVDQSRHLLPLKDEGQQLLIDAIGAITSPKTTTENGDA